MSGVRTDQLPWTPEPVEFLVNGSGGVGRVGLARAAGLIGARIGPTYATAAHIGQYRKSGAAGAGAWTRIGDLPPNAIGMAALEAEAAARQAGLAAEAQARAAALAAATKTLGAIRLPEVSGTANAMSASLPPDALTAGVAVSAGLLVEFVPPRHQYRDRGHAQCRQHAPLSSVEP